MPIEITPGLVIETSILLNTYIKFGSAPANVNDYDYVAESGTGNILDKDGNSISSPSFSNQTVVYVWGRGFSGISGEIKIIGTETVTYNGGTSYDTAVAITLTEDCEISLAYGDVKLGDSGGASE